MKLPHGEKHKRDLLVVCKEVRRKSSNGCVEETFRYEDGILHSDKESPLVKAEVGKAPDVLSAPAEKISFPNEDTAEPLILTRGNRALANYGDEYNPAWIADIVSGSDRICAYGDSLQHEVSQVAIADLMPPPRKRAADHSSSSCP